MKCNFCGNELPAGADFCPECGMIISLGGTEDSKAEAAEPAAEEVAEEVAEMPDFTPNVFKTMEFNEEPAVAAAELEVNAQEETAPVVEAIPEYVAQEPAYTEPEAPAQPEVYAQPVEEAPVADTATEEIFAPPEYKSELSYLDEVEAPVADTPEAQAQALFGDDFIPEAADVSGDTIEGKLEDTAANGEDNSLIEALFDPAAYPQPQEYEDITEAHNESIKKEKEKNKNSNKGYAMVFAIVVVLVGIIFAAGYVMDNILPKIQGNTTTDPSVNASVASTTLPTTTKPISVPSTVQPASSTTKPGSTTSTTKPGSTTSTTNTSSTTTTTTTSTTSTTSTTTTTTTKVSQTVKEPSYYNMDYVAYFPKNGDVTMRTSPSSSSGTVATQPYGYPLYAMASESGYYYVDSPYHGLEGWVLASSLVAAYEDDTTTTTTKPTSTTTTTTTSTTEPTTSEGDTTTTTTEPTTEYDDGYQEYNNPYTATISDALNFRSGPGTQYTVKGTVPYGYTVTVYGYSTTNNGWVYVEVTDERYEQYGALEGWVLSDYLY